MGHLTLYSMRTPSRPDSAFSDCTNNVSSSSDARNTFQKKHKAVKLEMCSECSNDWDLYCETSAFYLIVFHAEIRLKMVNLLIDQKIKQYQLW